MPRKLSLLFARRYLSSKKSHSVINIISRVSSFAVGVPVAAMVILLSAFNGFQQLVEGLYKDFDPDIAVSAAEGKVFDSGAISLERLRAIEGVVEVSEVLEDNALLEYRGRQIIATLRGVDSLYDKVVPVGKMVVDGEYEMWFGDMMQAVAGREIAYNLGIRPALQSPIKALVPRRGTTFSSLLPVNAYREAEIFPAGIFALDAETDGKYVLVPIEFARTLFDYPRGVSSLMVKTAPGANTDKVGAAISREVGGGYKVLTRYQQKASMYRIMTYEKWGIFLIILMVMVIASFSIVGSLAMTITDKRRDSRTLLNMGASVALVRRIFVNEGMFISLSGAVGGMLFGLLLCWLQGTFGLIKIPADTFLVDTYPVRVELSDMAAIVTAFIAVSFIVTKFTVLKMIPRSDIRI